MACVPPFMWFVKRGLNRFQDIISNRLQDHFFSNIISNMAINSHYTCFEVLHGLGGGCLIFYSPIIPPFCLVFIVFSSTLSTTLSLLIF
jgi:hypothetical protein